MNCHIGEDGGVDENMVMGTVLAPERTSLEKRTSTRGHDLLTWLDDFGLAVLNGRIPGDTPAQFTYIDERKKGTGEYFESSVIDLVLCNEALMPELCNLEVADHVNTSDHLPVELTLNIKINVHQRAEKTKKLKWKENLKEGYNDLLMSKLNNAECTLDNLDYDTQINTLSSILKTNIMETAEELSMVYYVSGNYVKKPTWFNAKCKTSKYLTRQKFRVWKKYKSDQNLEKFVKEKKLYKKIVAQSKKKYYQEQKDKLSNVKNARLFNNHFKQAISKASQALANIRQIMVNSKMNSWGSRIRLYEAVVKVTLLYATEVWALRYSDNIEVTQTKFIRIILCLYNTTPNHYLRLETGIVKLTSAVLQMGLRWWMRVKSMPETRLPKLCLEKLELIEVNYENTTYNWSCQLKKLFREANPEENFNFEFISKNLDEIVKRCETMLIKKDEERVKESSYNEYYKNIKLTTTRENYF
ncbi:hypothetical protein WDU94_003631 [Cyamophila willieti]